jgi:hypothetical protein
MAKDKVKGPLFWWLIVGGAFLIAGTILIALLMVPFAVCPQCNGTGQIELRSELIPSAKTITGCHTCEGIGKVSLYHRWVFRQIDDLPGRLK